MKKKMIAAAACSLILVMAGCSGNEEKQKGTDQETSTIGSEVTGENGRPEYTALDYVELGAYKGLEVELISTVPTEEEVDERITESISQSGKMEEVTEGTIGENDSVNIDYVGKVDGEDIDGGTDKNVTITMGGSNVIAGFDNDAFSKALGDAIAEKLAGAKIGDTLEVGVKIPEGYTADQELAGKDAVFEVTVNFVSRIPELTDELASELSDAKTVEGYRSDVKSQLVKEKESMQESQKLNDLFAQIYAASTIQEYPKAVVEYDMGYWRSYYETFAEQAGLTFDEYLTSQFNMTKKDFEEQGMQMIKDSLKREMLLRAIAETENLTITELEYQQGLEKYAEDSEMKTEEYLKANGKDTILLSLLLDKALAVIEDSAVVYQPGEKKNTEETEEKMTESNT